MVFLQGISKITPIKLLKSNDGLPVLVRDANAQTRDRLSVFDAGSATGECVCVLGIYYRLT